MFADRADTGRQLAEKILRLIDIVNNDNNVANNNNNTDKVVVLAIPRGGVIIGDIIASSLNVKLDIVVSRKIGAPFNEEMAIGAVMPDGTCFINTELVYALQIPQQYIAAKAEDQLKEIDRRLLSYRGHQKYDNEIKDKVVILVDDGIATGSTIYAAAQWVKAQKCSKLVIAVPVAPKDIVKMLKRIADMVVVIDSPISFQAVGQFYQDFGQVTDEEVRTIMCKHGYKPALGYDSLGIAE